MPNPWDAGSARLLEGMGFAALATTSAGQAWSCAQADGQIKLEATLAHMRAMVQASHLPMNADFEDGFASTAEGVYDNVCQAVATGVAGLSIEDSTGNPSAPMRPLEESVQRLRAARAAIDASGGDTLLVGRAENFFVGRPDLGDAIARLQAYAQAGADCLYAPGIRSAADIAAVVAAVAPKPVNVLIGWDSALSVSDLAQLGVRRISVGGALARAAWGGFIHAARQLAEQGRFDGFKNTPTGPQLNALFSEQPSQPPQP